MRTCLTSIEDCYQTKKEVELIFSPNQVYSNEKSAIKKSLLSYSVKSFFHRYILHGKF